MSKFKILFCIVLGVSLVSALDFSLTTNVDAEVSFNNGKKITNDGGHTQDVSVSGVTAQKEIEISVKSLNSRYADSTFSAKLSEYFVTYPAWEADKEYQGGTKISHKGKIWEAVWTNHDEPVSTPYTAWVEIQEDLPIAVVINLFAKELPADSAFIPIYSEVDATVDISSTIYNTKKELKAKTLDTLILPLAKGTSAITPKSANQKTVPARIISKLGHHLITLNPNEYKNADIRLLGINGKLISSEKLIGIKQTSLTLANVAAGIYVLNIKGIKGANFTSKIMHNGGDLRLAASFNGNFEIGGITNSRTIMAAETRASGDVKYKLVFSFGNTTKTMNITAGSQMNDNIYTSFLPENFSDLFSKEQYEKIFPNRYGFGRADCANKDATDPNGDCSKGKPATGPYDGDYDYYSYESFLKAIDLMGTIKVEYEFGRDPGMFKMIWTNKETGDIKIINHPKFVKGSGEIVTIDYADYCNFGDMKMRKRELAASLAHMTQETGGFGTSGDPYFNWGLYYREEVGNPPPAYPSTDPLEYYNPVPGKSYHGRGPKQLTHPYNYGPFSEFLYGDKDILLNNPDLLCPKKPEDATVAFASAIWFWMTPQPPKPSIHDVMIDNASEYITDIREKSRFGWTISIINGALECGSPNIATAMNRIYHYKKYLEVLGVSDDTADYGCHNMN